MSNKRKQHKPSKFARRFKHICPQVKAKISDKHKQYLRRVALQSTT